MARIRNTSALLPWIIVLAVIGLPVWLAALSPFLAWRQPVYIIAGFAGIIGLGLLVLQPLLIDGRLLGLSPRRRRQLHIGGGALLLISVGVHVIGLFITSPPDVIDALLFRSPTTFSAYGVIALAAVGAAAVLAPIKLRASRRSSVFRLTHMALVTIGVVCTVIHALLGEGTMEPFSKAALCLVALIVLVSVIIARRGRLKA